MQAQDQFQDRRTHIVEKRIRLSHFLVLFAACSFPVFGQNSFSTSSDAPSFEPARVDALVRNALQQGNFERGLSVYTQAKSACFSCHQIAGVGGRIGPDLSKVGKDRTPSQIAESLLWPNRLVAPEYLPQKILTQDGEQVVGYESKDESTESVIAIRDPATGNVTKLKRLDIEAQAPGQSLMPNGLVDGLNDQEQADLLAFLTGLGTGKDSDQQAMQAKIRSASTHEPASFAMERGPLRPENHLSHREHVNRDRIYDFYSKQAEYFSKLPQPPALLAQFPGLDGPNFGHWGNQNEESWKGDEMNQSVQGLVQCGVLVAERPIPRAVCFCFGPDRVWSACFNPDNFAYEKFWNGAFIKFSNVRHGLMDGFRIAGAELKLPSDARSIREIIPELNKSDIQYRGYYVHGDQILFLYEANGNEYLDVPTIEKGVFKRVAARKDVHPMRNLLTGGPRQWPQMIETKIEYGDQRGYAIDTIELPINNPWKTLLYCGDHAFLKDGSAIVATLQGDVWRVQNIAFNPSSRSSTARWSRIASGLYQATGVVVHDEQIYVLGRNQITRLVDLNADGETDYYECFSSAFKTSPGGHDYICGLQRDDKGNFYIASGNQGVVQISSDGQDAKVLGTGFRNPDGLGLLPDGTITVPASEGDWTPASMLFQIEPKELSSGRTLYESTPPPFFGHKGPKDWQKVELPLVYLPRGVDNSSGGQVWVDDPRMGPLHQQIVHTSYGTGQAMLVLRDKVGEQWQGAVVVLPGDFRSGIHRARMNRVDGCLYFSGMNGWGSYTPDAGCFQRMRYTGDDLSLPLAFHVHANGISVKFNRPLDPSIIENSSNRFAQCWNYRYSGGYGSKEYSVLHGPMLGHDLLTISSAHLLDGNRTLFLEIPTLQKCSQLHLRIKTSRDDAVDMFATVHDMDRERTDIPSLRSVANKKILPHPMLQDLEWLKRSIPNPHVRRLNNTRDMNIAARDNLQYSTKTLEATAGERIKLTFSNPDVVPHNWALVRQGALQRTGELANKLVNDAEAFLRHYVPQSEDVLCYTNIVNPGEETVVYFEVPPTPGRYPFLCTFPGHWMVMNGELIVKPKP